jgi:anti-sigma regulatory factor (Ser/Thr protein kinase)
MKYDAVATYDCGPGQVAPARRWAHQALSQRLADGADSAEIIADGVVEDAVLVISELVTNAIRADCSQVEVGITVERDAVLVGVVDDAAGTPQPRSATGGDVAGRGLQIVAAVARQWGVRPAGLGGRPAKEVWASLPLRRQALLPADSAIQ